MARGGMGGVGRALRQDASVLKESIKPGTTLRVLRFAVTYGGGLSLFGAVVVLSAFIGNLNPLLYKRIIDVAIPAHDGALVVRLALLAALILVADAVLGLFQSYLSARIGRENCRQRGASEFCRSGRERGPNSGRVGTRVPTREAGRPSVLRRRRRGPYGRALR